MGMISIVYGIIQGPDWPSAKVHEYNASMELTPIQRRYLDIDEKLREKVRRNLHAIATLPEDDDTWPFLSRSMFASSTHSIQTTYKAQIIHFGASFKSIEWGWDEWLEKFESLLRTMYWDEVNLHLISEMYTTTFDYTWQDENEDKAVYPDHSDPVASWSFSGGPRVFE
jgi:hypothetical protein